MCFSKGSARAEISTLNTELVKVFNILPRPSFAFAYGSSVFPQDDNPVDWHTENMRLNPSHYSFPIRGLGPTTASSVQTSSFGAKVYFNTLIHPINGPTRRSFKYGVISVRDMMRDLIMWESLYVAGRMHKPVQIVFANSQVTSLQHAAAKNLVSATSAALLTLPSHFEETDLYTAAANLSYAGDVRMTARAEVRNKVQNIVKGNLAHFRSLYTSAVEDAGVVKRCDGIWERHVCKFEQRRLLTRLPSPVFDGLRRSFGLPYGGLDIADEISRYDRKRVRAALLATTAGIVMRSSIRQSLKGILTAGIGTSIRYVAAKVSKAIAARGETVSAAVASRTIKKSITQARH